MRVLFDNGTPRGVAAALTEHMVEEARSHGRDTLGNGELLDAAEATGFDVFVTTDRNLQYQQNLTGRKIAIVVLDKARWKLIRRKLPEIAAAVASAKQGSFVLVEIPTD
jgi:predicted GNAT family acetyltransferase